MGLNLQKLAKISGTNVEATDEWSVGKRKSLETLKQDWVKLIKSEIRKVANDKSGMVRYSVDSWKVRLVKSTVALKFDENEVLSIGDTSNSKEMITKVLENIQQQIKDGNLNKEIMAHMDTCRANRDKYKR